MMGTNKSEYENCVICGATTKEMKVKSIDLRNNYIEGAGQLCGKCYVEVYEGE